MAYTEHSDGLYSFDGFPVVAEFAEDTHFHSTSKGVEIYIGKPDKSYKIMTWGDKNNLCDVREALLSPNNIVPRLLKTARNILLGLEVFAFQKVLISGKRGFEEVNPDSPIQEFLDEIHETTNFWEDLANDFIKNEMAYVRFLQGIDGKYSMKVIKARYVRPQEMNDKGVIENFFTSGNWKKKEDIKKYPSFQGIKDEKYPAQFIMKISDDFMGNEYFAEPTWFTGHKWIQIGNKIPEFHTFNLKNQYFTPLHIEIPKGYFYDSKAVKEGTTTETEAREAEVTKRTAFLQKVDSVLAGAKNAGKAVWSEYSINQMQKEYGGIKFTPLKIPRNDDALLKLFEKTNEANISGTGVHPSLAAIITQGGLSSGSEIRNALYMYIITQALQPRKQLLKPLYVLKRLNGFDKKLKFGYRDVELTTTDANPNGQQAVTAN